MFRKLRTKSPAVSWGMERSETTKMIPTMRRQPTMVKAMMRVRAVSNVRTGKPCVRAKSGS